jgi:hypothetical protein
VSINQKEIAYCEYGQKLLTVAKTGHENVKIRILDVVRQTEMQFIANEDDAIVIRDYLTKFIEGRLK